MPPRPTESPVALAQPVGLAIGLLALLGLVAACGAERVATGTRPPASTGEAANAGPPQPESESESESGPDDRAAAPREAADGPIAYEVNVVAEYPHDPTAYTQGLEVVDGLLLESTGVRGESTIRLVDPASGERIRNVDLDDELFGEGATVVGDEVWQLTYTSGTAFLRGLDDLAVRRRATYDGEGWGLCSQDDRLIMSNGSSALTFRDPASFEAIGSVEVSDDDGPVANLNELECVGDLVWANIYQSTRLVAIDPRSGRVVGSTDLTPLVPDGFEGDADNVVNGIAHDPATGRYWLTGKRWPVLYEVELVPAP